LLVPDAISVAQQHECVFRHDASLPARPQRRPRVAVR
jgi:hypothetical protein